MEDLGIADAITQLQQSGKDLKREYSIEHFIFSEDEDQMSIFAAKARDAGFVASDVDYIDPEEEDEDGPPFYVCTVVGSVPEFTESFVTDQCNAVSAIAEACGVTYDGWGAGT